MTVTVREAAGCDRHVTEKLDVTGGPGAAVARPIRTEAERRPASAAGGVGGARAAGGRAFKSP